MKSTTILLLTLALLTGCSFDTIPPAHKGKILGPAGYHPEVLPPGKVTTWFRDDLVLLETPVRTLEEQMSVLMQDRLTLRFDVRIRSEIRDDAGTINSMFDRVSPEGNRVTFEQVYLVYGQPAVRNKSREVMTRYTVDDVIQNYERISTEMFKEISKSLEGTPLVVTEVAVAELRFPDVVTQAVENAKKRELEIAQEEAQVEIEMTKKEGERRLAQADYEIRLLKAKTVRDENKVIGEGVTKELLALKTLEVQEAMAKNESAVFIPYQAIDTIGANIRMFQQN